MHVFHRLQFTMAALATAVASLLLGAAACSPTQPSSGPKIETFSGTVAPGSGASNPFTVSRQGDVYITLKSLDPPTSAPLGIAIGMQQGATCTVTSSTTTIQVGDETASVEPPGNYCVGLYDIGYLTSDETYTLTVSHY